MSNKQALGKGLSALIAESNTSSTQPSEEHKSIDKLPSISTISIAQIKPSRDQQPRFFFDKQALEELASSVKDKGLIQPIVVRPYHSGKDKQEYLIVAGERRWRACKQAGLDNVPVIIRNLNDKEALEFAIIENIQRESLTAIEEAEGYSKLLREYDYTQQHIADQVGKSRSHISNMLRLLELPIEVKDMINRGELSMSHARALVGSENAIVTASLIAKEGMSVREAEKYSSGYGKRGGGKRITDNKQSKISSKNSKDSSSSFVKDDDLIALERTLSENIGLTVKIEDLTDGGQVQVSFNNLSELDIIIQKLGS